MGCHLDSSWSGSRCLKHPSCAFAQIPPSTSTRRDEHRPYNFTGRDGPIFRFIWHELLDLHVDLSIILAAG